VLPQCTMASPRNPYDRGAPKDTGIDKTSDGNRSGKRQSAGKRIMGRHGSRGWRKNNGEKSQTELPKTQRKPMHGRETPCAHRKKKTGNEGETYELVEEKKKKKKKKLRDAGNCDMCRYSRNGFGFRVPATNAKQLQLTHQKTR
jgi:hypothetical protein